MHGWCNHIPTFITKLACANEAYVYVESTIHKLPTQQGTNLMFMQNNPWTVQIHTFRPTHTCICMQRVYSLCDSRNTVTSNFFTCSKYLQ